MEIGFSEELSLLQLKDHPKPEIMFNENYPFLLVVQNIWLNIFLIILIGLRNFFQIK